ncbi:response regulator [Aliikangiella sp. G2MR2-5]|uniref:response regulator n=1 Tax=Aliikangiella sp. G2MR2-5 TaxID=2788943 RepID=UPI0018A9EE4D|nr:response regulator [Aliikangiella sp. G2MR2-5]
MQVKSSQRNFLLGLVLFLTSFNLFADSERGRSFFSEYPPEIYGGGYQIWNFTQDSQGVIYAANNGGVFSFDSHQWKNIENTNRLLVISLDVDPDDSILVGAAGDFGLVSTAENGKKIFRSLKDDFVDAGLISSSQQITEILDVVFFEDKYYFLSPSHIYRWQADGELAVFQGNELSSFAIFKGELFVYDNKKGLERISDTGLQLIIDEIEFESSPVVFMLNDNDLRLLVGSKENGIYVVQNNSVSKLESQYLEKNKNFGLMHGVLSLDGALVLGFEKKSGVAILDNEGRLIQKHSKASGLSSDDILTSFIDANNTLWLGSNNGVLRIEAFSPLTTFDVKTGLVGVVHRIVRFDGQLYVATSEGVFYLNKGISPAFHRMNRVKAQCFSLIATDNGILAGCEDRVYQIVGDSINLLDIEKDLKVYALQQLKKHPDIILIGLSNGLAYLQRVQNQWHYKGRLLDSTPPFREIKQDDNNIIWMNTFYEGIYRANFDYESKSVTTQIVTAEQGLPSGYPFLMLVDGKILFGTNDGVLEIEEGNIKNKKMLSRDPRFVQFINENGYLLETFHQSENGKLWFTGSGLKLLGGMKLTNGVYMIDSTHFDRRADFYTNIIYAENNAVWAGGLNGLLKLDLMSQNHEKTSKLMISKTVDIYRQTELFGGGKQTLIPEIEYMQNSLRFEFALTSFDAPDKTLYQYRLEGFNDSWSDWSSETYREFTNLDEGSYVFSVRAKDLYHQSEAAEFRFVILAPWYRSWWAYIVYGVIFLMLAQLWTRWKSQSIQRKNRLLEKRIGEKTTEIQLQKHQLEMQNIQLVEMSNYKSRFYTNISHELRTPLSLSIAPVADILEGKLGQVSSEIYERLTLVQKNSRHLLNYINQLLDMTREDSLHYELKVELVNLLPIVRSRYDAFYALSKRKEVSFTVEIPETPVEILIDRQMFIHALDNLLNNAFKFTDKGGAVHLKVKNSSDSIFVEVIDTGIGIDNERLSKIFDRYFQVGASGISKKKGIGVGLNFVQEIMKQHHGQVNVESEVGSGSHFSLLFQKGTEHFSEELAKQERYGSAQKVGEPQDYDTLCHIDNLSHSDNLNHSDKTGRTDKEDIIRVKDGRREKFHILVVEDNRELQNYLVERLGLDYQVSGADNGKEALAIAQSSLPDIILSDIAMPQMDGKQLCQAIKSDPLTSHIAVILLTAQTSQEQIVSGLESGADDYLVKPFEPHSLELKLANLVNTRQQLHARYNQTLGIKTVDLPLRSANDVFMKRVLEVIDLSLDSSDFTVETLALQIGLGRRQLLRKIKALTNKSPSELIKERRLHTAADLLKAKVGNVSEVAYRCGFEDPAYFSKEFKLFMGVPPSEYSRAN